MEKYQVKAGDFIKPKLWKVGEILLESDGYKDSSFAGCMFRLPSGDRRYNLAVNITVVGEPKYNRHGFHKLYKSPIKIEFVGDGQPSTFTSGIVYHN
jgi:hypothetical protein